MVAVSYATPKTYVSLKAEYYYKNLMVWIIMEL